ncbi:hypothetical protein Ae201684P_008022 [Aphanomyces euteiches]|nr:hypothetical protein Ae201684P_008022 [Aphanomyces euteiches]
MSAVVSDPTTTTYAYAGIVVGFVVFLATLAAVFFLLYCGGSFERMKHEAAGMPTSLDQEKPQLYDELLEKAASLPLKPAAFSLDGQFVKLRPLDSMSKSIVGTLFDISSGKALSGIYGGKQYDADALIWRFMLSGPYQSVEEFARHRCTEVDNQRIFMRAATSLLACTGVHREVVFLLLDALFAASYRRVEWRTDGFNVRSRKAAHGLGFTMEGVLRKHMIVRGANRDTVVFAALNSEWPVIKEMLTTKLTAMMQKGGKFKNE